MTPVHLGINHERPTASLGDDDAILQRGVVAWQSSKTPLPCLLWVLSTQQQALENMQALTCAIVTSGIIVFLLQHHQDRTCLSVA